MTTAELLALVQSHWATILLVAGYVPFWLRLRLELRKKQLEIDNLKIDNEKKRLEIKNLELESHRRQLDIEEKQLDLESKRAKVPQLPRPVPPESASAYHRYPIPRPRRMIVIEVPPEEEE